MLVGAFGASTPMGGSQEKASPQLAETKSHERECSPLLYEGCVFRVEGVEILQAIRERAREGRFILRDRRREDQTATISADNTLCERDMARRACGFCANIIVVSKTVVACSPACLLSP
jgi:hypothetical protein